ncbi:hypothetical protein [Iodidimonas sp. SYSU 1G8]|uniref:hypothetical protein n=1 Tax=Iodidimonas sp. SYSU 1G8 TaxID=3133967 RepID=UPI0031FEE9CC
MGLLGILTGGGGGTPKYAKKTMLEAFEKTKQVANMPFEAYTAPRVAGLSGTQQMGIQSAINNARSNVGGGAVNSAINLAQQAAAYRPTMVTPGTMAASMLAPVADVSAASIDRNAIGNVVADSFLGGDVSAYMNPYIGQVIDTTMADLARQREMQRQADNARAVQARAFGGSRQAVVDAETNAGFNNTLASTVAGLYSQGYDRASSLMMQDYDRAMQARAANQGVDASVAAQNAGFGQAAALANQNVRYDQAYQNAALAQQAAQNNMNAAMEAQRLNQEAGLAGANLGLGASSALAGFGRTQQEMAQANAQALIQAGTLEQMVAQAKLDADYEEFMRKTGYPVQMATLMQGGGQMMSAAKSNQGSGLLSGLGSLATGLGNLGANWLAPKPQ